MTPALTALAQWAYEGLVETYRRPNGRGAGTRRRFFDRLRSLILRRADPVVSMTVDAQTILLRLSHSYPLLKAAHPYYDTGLRRLCSFVRAIDGRLAMIDVGANVGDGLVAVAHDLPGQFLCIEADDRHFPLLERNADGIEGVTCRQVVCDEADGELTGTLVHAAGTSHLTSDGRGHRMIHRTLDRIVADQPALHANVLKVDTDGYDYRVLRGARGVLERDAPVIFFELAPEYLVAAGEDPMAIFPFLVASGYPHLFLYDNQGLALCRADASAQDTLRGLLSHARMVPGRYYDAVAFPARRSADFDRFVADESRVFGNTEL